MSAETQHFPRWEGSMVQRNEKSAWALLPYLMPESVNEDGETVSQGRYAISYSRDGWFVLDTENMLVLRWCVTEQDAIAARDQIVASS